MSSLVAKRIMSDLKTIRRANLEKSNIFVAYDDDNIYNMKALIIGPEDTPYHGGFYLFDIIFPRDYPSNPPKVRLMTTNRKVRFNPNLYKCGKVCLSILNTWRGPQWTGCQTISSILLCICASVLTDTPLINEPGITEKHRDFDTYNKIITFKNYEVAIIEMLTNKNISERFEPLMPELIKHFKNNYSQILKNLEKVTCEYTTLTTSIYQISVFINYDLIKKQLNELYLSLKN